MSYIKAKMIIAAMVCGFLFVNCETVWADSAEPIAATKVRAFNEATIKTWADASHTADPFESLMSDEDAHELRASITEYYHAANMAKNAWLGASKKVASMDMPKGLSKEILRELKIVRHERSLKFSLYAKRANIKMQQLELINRQHSQPTLAMQESLKGVLEESQRHGDNSTTHIRIAAKLAGAKDQFQFL